MAGDKAGDDLPVAMRTSGPEKTGWVADDGSDEATPKSGVNLPAVTRMVWSLLVGNLVRPGQEAPQSLHPFERRFRLGSS
jgi:hypothetical protein